MKQFFFIDCNDFFPTLLVQWRYHVVKNSGLFEVSILRVPKHDGEKDWLIGGDNVCCDWK